METIGKLVNLMIVLKFAWYIAMIHYAYLRVYNRKKHSPVLLHISYCGFCAPITPAITGPWFNPIRNLNRWNDSRLIWSSAVINAMAKSTRTSTLCSSVRFASYIEYRIAVELFKKPFKMQKRFLFFWLDRMQFLMRLWKRFIFENAFSRIHE